VSMLVDTYGAYAYIMPSSHKLYLCYTVVTSLVLICL